MQTQYKVMLVSSMVAVAVGISPMVEANSGSCVPTGAVEVHLLPTTTEIEMPADPDAPKIGVYENQAGQWDLTVSAPIIWTDKLGNSHELTSLNQTWKKWLDAFAKQVLQRWSNDSAHPNESCSASITLMGKRKPVNGLSFTPEQSAEGESFTNIVKDVTGISNGKQLGTFLPKDAKTATALYLNLRFVRR
jgi:hypothetical protein